MVCVSLIPRSAIMITKSLKLNLKLVYQLTHRMMICPSKCRPLNSASTGPKGCILPSSPDRACLHQNRLNHTFEYRKTFGVIAVEQPLIAVTMQEKVESFQTKFRTSCDTTLTKNNAVLVEIESTSQHDRKPFSFNSSVLFSQ